MKVWKGRDIDDKRYFIHENGSTPWIPPAVAVRIEKLRIACVASVSVRFWSKEVQGDK